MKHPSSRFLALAVTSLSMLPMLLCAELPERWLDSLTTVLDNYQSRSDAARYRSHMVTETLDDGEVKTHEETWYLVDVGDDELVMHRTDSSGTILEREAERESLDEDRRGKDDPDSPFAALRPAFREHYRIQLLERRGSELLLAWKPGEELEKSFVADSALVDTNGWVIRRVTGRPDPLPSKRLKELTMTIHFEPDEAGRWWFSRIETEALASLLFFKVQAKIDQHFFEWTPKRAGADSNIGVDGSGTE